MADQLVNSKKGEIEFRKKLFQQQVEGKSIFTDEFDREGIKTILDERMKNTFDRMSWLREQGVNLSSYIEIGAERCQRSLVMENNFNATGAACDISYDMLKSCDYYSKVFNKSKIPLRICCDANSLPFKSGSIPFIFCYETLHHFPDPGTIVKEIHRVLSPDGYFFLDEEPYKKILHINLYRTKNIYSQEMLNVNLIKRALEFFFAQKSCNEVNHGIIENDEISIPVWKRALSVFEEKDIQLQALKRINTELFKPKHLIQYILAYLLGGRISGLCRKPGIRKEINILDALICPSCREHGHESNIARINNWFACNTCGNHFPIVHGIVFLFSPRMLEELYPEIFKTVIEKAR